MSSPAARRASGARAADKTNWRILMAAGVPLFIFAGLRRSRYFGNITPLVMVVVTAFLMTTQVFSAPWLWALPFLFTFIGGVFADVLETRQRKLFLFLLGGGILTQAVFLRRA